MSLILYLIIVFFVGYWVWKQRERLELNTKSLHKQLLFKLVIIFPLVSSLYFVIWLGAPYPFKFDANGYNAFLEINKFSLGILALSPILGAFVVYAHRSYQTEIQIKTAKEQLEEAQKKNKVDMYYAKRKFINEQLATIRNFNSQCITKTNTLYLKFYLIGTDYNDEIKIDSLNLLNQRLTELQSKYSFLSEERNRLKLKGEIISKDEKNIISKELMVLLDMIKKLYFNLCFTKNETERKVFSYYTFQENYKFLDDSHLNYLKVRDQPFDYIRDIDDGFVRLLNKLDFFIFKLKSEVREVSVILLSGGIDIKSFLPSLDDDVQSQVMNIGDELAAENQNPHESS